MVILKQTAVAGFAFLQGLRRLLALGDILLHRNVEFLAVDLQGAEMRRRVKIGAVFFPVVKFAVPGPGGVHLADDIFDNG